MSYFSATTEPAQGFEAVEAVVVLIQAISALTAKLGSASYVYAHRSPEPPTVADGKWKRVVVRAPVLAQGYRVNVGKTKGQRIDVMVEIQEGVEKPDTFLAQAHYLIYQNIVNQALTLTRGAPIGAIQPYSEPTAAGYDADSNSFYSTAGYVLAMMPA
ncbi:MAG TPA: hypothetical protein VKN76_12080 [Kiloniellaceae bacterium]|nr:hypothetical protein [Kiloniellaceae bacterium]